MCDNVTRYQHTTVNEYSLVDLFLFTVYSSMHSILMYRPLSEHLVSMVSSYWMEVKC